MCGYCNKDYHVLNTTREYSSIEISILYNIRILRVRAGFNEKGIFNLQDAVHINYCPMCGKKLGKEE